jgi:hypothetical protein
MITLRIASSGWFKHSRFGDYVVWGTDYTLCCQGKSLGFRGNPEPLEK